jgi:hypothetical protein
VSKRLTVKIWMIIAAILLSLACVPARAAPAPIVTPQVGPHFSPPAQSPAVQPIQSPRIPSYAPGLYPSTPMYDIPDIYDIPATSPDQGVQ